MNASHPENEPDDNDSPEPMHAEFQHRAVTARVTENAAMGVFSNAAVILSGNFEFVLDFVLRMGKPDRVMARVVLPVPVVEQFVRTLRESLGNYEKQFGVVPDLVKPGTTAKKTPDAPKPPEGSGTVHGSFVGSIGPDGNIAASEESGSKGRGTPSIDEIYDDLKLDDNMLGGAYANAVLIRHSATEFCFDFVTNIYPRSSVTARVFMAVPQVPPLLNSLSHSFDQFRRRNPPPPQTPPPEDAP
ncbi:DUF3467 domain-containing protein [Rubinisphaera margarita]|uniref:DUF3467 domain-containing protein n=1 Tax=Rubinisphaera margarita TaxID=2909586 RepID=UPI001EE8B709|nr:DUF3467 domain-containing protein [Rubinisphaera margarita]MCG6158443.1 DUF3467 domain-containing protein [Rubinisphaera margarita]